MSIQYTLYCDLCMKEITITFDPAALAEIIMNPEIVKKRIYYRGTAATLSAGQLIDRCTKCFEEGRREKK